MVRVRRLMARTSREGDRSVDSDPCVSVAADEELTLRRVCGALEAAGLRPVASGRTARDAIAGDHAPDVVVVACDVARPSELAALRGSKALLREAHVVVVSPPSTATGVRQALDSGAAGVVFESQIDAVLAIAVRSAAAEQLSVPRLLGRCIARPVFSHREKQVLSLVARGLGNGEIARRLYLAESTIKSHLSTSFEKLGVHSRREAAAVIADPAEGLAEQILRVDLIETSAA